MKLFRPFILISASILLFFLTSPLLTKELKFEYASPFQKVGDELLAIVKYQGKYGVINDKGEWKINARFGHIDFFHEGLARFRSAQGKRYGFINKQGKIVVPPIFSFVRPFSEKRAAVLIGEKWGYINEKGKIVIRALYKQAFSFHEGLARVVKDSEKYALGYTSYINKGGREVISGEIEYGSSFVNGFAVVSKDEKFGIIKKNGQLHIPYRYNSIGDLDHGLVPFALKTKWGFLELKSGKVKIPARYDAVFHFSNGLARVKSKYKWGYIDKNGKSVIKNAYDHAWNFHEGLAPVSIRHKGYGMINKKGNWFLKPQFSYISQVKDGKIIIRNNYKALGMMDTQGKWFVQPVYRKLWHFQHGYALVATKTRWGYLNQEGKVPEWSFNTSDDKEKDE